MRAAPPVRSGVVRAATVGLLVLVITGCATFSEDGGFDAVSRVVEEGLGTQALWTRDEGTAAVAAAEVARLLRAELSADSAMQIGLLNNAALQSAYAELGISEADYVQAGRLPNPGFSFSRTSGGGEREIERGLHFGLLGILTMPLRLGIESRRFEAAKLAAAMAAVEVGLSARTAFVEAVSAQERVRYMEQVVESADAGRELMTRMARVGNASRLDLAREQLFHAEVMAGLARATRQADAAREALVRALGLWGEQLTFRLPERLPALPEAAREIAQVEQEALRQRLDLRRAQHDLEGLSRSLGLTRATRFVNVLELGPIQVREGGAPVRDGYEIALEIPLFDWGSARVARAEAVYLQAAERLRGLAVDARSEVRQAYHGYRASYDLARHYRDEVVPLRRRISEEQLLRYNGMLIGVFELLADARVQVESVNAYLDALRDFWLADSALQRATLTSGAPGAALAGMPAPSAAAGGAGH